MKQLFSILFLLLFAGLSSAQSLSVEKLTDYLEIDPVYYTEGDFKGLAVDQSIKRPVQLIPELETNDSYFVSNFYNQKQFWVAEIPKKGVKNVIFQLALFKGPLVFTLAHAQFRFLMSQPLNLYRVKDGQIKRTRTGDLIFTAQAALPAGKKYQALDAFKGTYKMMARLTNTFDRSRLEEVDQGDIVTQYLLKNMSADQMNNLLLNSVKFSDENLLNKDYVATSDNCISVAFDILDQSLEMNYGRVVLTLKNTLFNGLSPNETMAVKALEKRNLIDRRLQNYK